MYTPYGAAPHSLLVYGWMLVTVVLNNSSSQYNLSLVLTVELAVMAKTWQ